MVVVLRVKGKLQLLVCACFDDESQCMIVFFQLYVGRVSFSANRCSIHCLCLHGRREVTTPNYNFIRAFSKTARVVDLENAFVKLY